MDYIDYQTGIAPPWLQQKWGDAWIRIGAALRDVYKQGAKQAVKANLASLAPSDALPLIGSARGLDQAPAELEAAYRARLIAAWEAWKWAGTATGVVNILNAFGYSSVEVFENNGAASAHWTGPPDGDTAKWWRFWVRINQPNPWAYRNWGTGVWGENRTFGSTAQGYEIDTIRRLIRQWRPATVQCAGVIVDLGSSRTITWPVDIYPPPGEA